MPSYSEEQRKYQISRIRAVLILKPNASLREIQETLEESAEAPLHLQLNYIGKLTKKIVSERTRRNDNLNIGSRLSTVQDKKNMIDSRLWIEAANPRNPAIARIAALEKLMKNELELLQAEMDAGLFERKLGTFQINGKITEERKILIIQAFQNFGIIKKVDPALLLENKENDNNGNQAGDKTGSAAAARS